MSNQPPKPKALSDADLALAIENAGGALAAMELLEEQTRLRAEDASALAAWQKEQAQATESLPEDDITEPQPQAAVGFATGSFDIIESAEQSVSEDSEANEDEFDYLLADGELPFAKEPASKKLEKSGNKSERRSKPLSQLLVWSSLTLGVAPMLLAAFSSKLGLSFTETVSGIAIGLAFSSMLIAIAAIAGKRSGLATLILSRAAFGVRGNLFAAIPLVIIKLIFGSALLFAAVDFFDGAFVGLPNFKGQVILDSEFPTWQTVFFLVLLVLAGVLAVFGGKTLYWSQVAVAGFGLVATGTYVVGTANRLQVPAFDLPHEWNFFGVAAVAAIAATLFGAFWVTAVAEFTRKIPMRESGAKVAIWVAVATWVVPVLVAAYAFVAINSTLKDFQIAESMNSLVLVMWSAPSWCVPVLLYSALATLVIWVASWLYATSVSFASVGIKLHPAASQPLILLVAILVSTFAAELVNLNFIAVLIFAWAGVFVGDVALRRIAYDEISLTRDYGFYKTWNLANLAGFLIAIAVGLGLVSGDSNYFGWLGYISTKFGGLGIFVAAFIGILFPILFGRKRVRLQEEEVLKIENRRNDLTDVEIA